MTDQKKQALNMTKDSRNYFYPMSILKLILMMLATTGLYGLFWWYKNWQSIKQAEASKIWPVPRSLFVIFFIYPFSKRVFSGKMFQVLSITLSVYISAVLFNYGFLALEGKPALYLYLYHVVVVMFYVAILVIYQCKINQVFFKFKPKDVETNFKFYWYNYLLLIFFVLLIARLFMLKH